MSERERLIELIMDAPFGKRAFGERWSEATAETIADHILTNGFIEEIQNEAYDLGVDSALHHHFGLSWEDAAGLRKEVERLKDAFRWIPVTERLPEEDLSKESKTKQLKVMVAYKTNGRWVVRTQIRAKDYWYDSEGRWQWIKTSDPITHWRSLPEPPKEEV